MPFARARFCKCCRNATIPRPREREREKYKINNYWTSWITWVTIFISDLHGMVLEKRQLMLWSPASELMPSISTPLLLPHVTWLTVLIRLFQDGPWPAFTQHEWITFALMPLLLFGVSSRLHSYTGWKEAASGADHIFSGYLWLLKWLRIIIQASLTGQHGSRLQHCLWFIEWIIRLGRGGGGGGDGTGKKRSRKICECY